MTIRTILLSLLTAAAAGTAAAQPSVGVSIGIHQPGVYGRIEIGNVPAPALVLPQPVVIAQPAYHVDRRPIYLYVPPAHQQDWRRYCGRYSACNQPVYFVRDQWVRERWDEHHRHRNWDRRDDRREDRWDRRDDRRDARKDRRDDRRDDRHDRRDDRHDRRDDRHDRRN